MDRLTDLQRPFLPLLAVEAKAAHRPPGIPVVRRAVRVRNVPGKMAHLFQNVPIGQVLPGAAAGRQIIRAEGVPWTQEIRLQKTQNALTVYLRLSTERYSMSPRGEACRKLLGTRKDDRNS